MPADDAEQAPESQIERRGKRREYLREYLRWLWPHRYGGRRRVRARAAWPPGLQMIEPLFMRFIIDRVLLNTELDTAVAAAAPATSPAAAVRRRGRPLAAWSACSRTIASGC